MCKGKCIKSYQDYYGSNNGNLQAIDVIEAYGLDFLLGNVIKYVLRAGKKEDDKRSDLTKALWYLQRSIDNLPKVESITDEVSTKAVELDVIELDHVPNDWGFFGFVGHDECLSWLRINSNKYPFDTNRVFESYYSNAILFAHDALKHHGIYRDKEDAWEFRVMHDKVFEKYSKQPSNSKISMTIATDLYLIYCMMYEKLNLGANMDKFHYAYPDKETYLSSKKVGDTDTIDSHEPENIITKKESVLDMIIRERREGNRGERPKRITFEDSGSLVRNTHKDTVDSHKPNNGIYIPSLLSNEYNGKEESNVVPIEGMMPAILCKNWLDSIGHIYDDDRVYEAYYSRSIYHAWDTFSVKGGELNDALDYYMQMKDDVYKRYANKPLDTNTSRDISIELYRIYSEMYSRLNLGDMYKEHDKINSHKPEEVSGNVWVDANLYNWQKTVYDNNTINALSDNGGIYKYDKPYTQKPEYNDEEEEEEITMDSIIKYIKSLTEKKPIDTPVLFPNATLDDLKGLFPTLFPTNSVTNHDSNSHVVNGSDIDFDMS